MEVMGIFPPPWGPITCRLFRESDGFCSFGKKGSGGPFPGTTVGTALRAVPRASPTQPKTGESLLMGPHLRRAPAGPLPADPG